LSLAEDREGNIWVGTVGGGLNRIRRRAVNLEGTESGLPFPSVQSICEDRSGRIWAATQNGIIARREGNSWVSMRNEQDWPQDATCLTAGPDGSLWVGTRLHGLYCWRDGHFVDWGDRKSIRGQTLHTLLVSKNGDLWIGEETPHAIQRLRKGELKTFEVPQDIRIIRAMAEDSAGTIWAASSKGILFRIQDEKLQEVTPRADELASIRALTTTPDGTLWIGYAGWGIGRLKGDSYCQIRAEDGFYDNWISHIVPDEQGWLWFGGNRGLFKVRQDDLESFASRHSQRVRSIHYGRGEGLPSLQANFGDSPDSLRSRDGRLWIPMRTYLAVVHPDKLGENAEPPATLLTHVSVDDQQVGWYRGILPPPKSASPALLDLGSADSQLVLPPTHRQIDFEFAALNFIAPDNVQFRYRLEPLDYQWQEAGTKRSARYTRLNAGNYVFRVIACNAEGVWSKTGAVMGVQVNPFFWQTWTFRFIVLAAFTGALVAIVRYVSFRRLTQRLRLLEQQAALHKERARIAKDIHDDLGANLTQIALLGELARQDRGEPDRAAERTGKISATARQAIKSLDEIVWAVNPRNDTLAHLIDYAGQFALDYLRLAGIRGRLDFPEQTPIRQLSTDLRHNLFLVIKEALNNIVKHADAAEVWLRVQLSEQTLQIIVADNGKGFAAVPDNATSDGLRNMRQRMAEIGGECRIESNPGNGTKVIIALPWRAENEFVGK
ncbi:MAG TPA: two-component regulator propeller domain-containing protein, partial [Candidatus Dormibacteraeota bacterium]|nr:two-component regulator propeller domain-containing protein [Candidatus Dormibacteraeota bacterium]